MEAVINSYRRTQIRTVWPDLVDLQLSYKFDICLWFIFNAQVGFTKIL